MKFIYQIDRKETDSGIDIILYSLNDKKEAKTEQKTIKYTIYIKKEDFLKLKIESDNIDSSKTMQNLEGELVLRVDIADKELYDYVRKEAREHEFEVFEADIPYEHRYLIDEDLELIDDESKLKLPKYVSVDIETIGPAKSQEIVLISAYSPDSNEINKVYCDMSKVPKAMKNKVEKYKPKDYKLEKFEKEEDMLKKFKEDILSFNPQLIIGWNVIDFDFKIIKERFDVYDIPFTFSNFSDTAKLRLFNDFFKDSTMVNPGILVWDLIHIIKKNFIAFDDYKLDTVARAVLGDNKIKLENDENSDQGMDEKINAITHMLNNDTVKLIDYNFKDSLLTSKIMEKLNLLELMCKRSILTGTPIQKVRSPIATLDIMYLKELHKRRQVAKTNFNYSDSTPIEGAYVKEPTSGFYEDIFVMDFKSLYPSIIVTFNVDPFTYSKKGEIEAPNGAKFIREPGILPGLITTLSNERDIAKKDKDETKSFALKINMNSFYGAIASPKSRFYNKDVGEAITSFARHIVITAGDFVEKMGHEVIYGDTDSIFIKFNKDFKSNDAKIKFGREVEAQVNEFFKKWCKDEYKVESSLNIEFEKLYSKFFIASKKRYVGYDEFTSKTQFVGMEAIRGDWTHLAKNFQRELIDMIFKNSDNDAIKKFTLDYIKDLKSGKFDDLLVYTKKITKPLNEYVKMTPPHVKAAREVKGFSGRVVKYILTKNGPKHVSLFGDKDEIDYEHYINKQLKGVSDDILDALGLDFDKIVLGIKQKGLDSFF